MPCLGSGRCRSVAPVRLHDLRGAGMDRRQRQTERRTWRNEPIPTQVDVAARRTPFVALAGITPCSMATVVEENDCLSKQFMRPPEQGLLMRF